MVGWMVMVYVISNCWLSVGGDIGSGWLGVGGNGERGND